MRPPVSMPLAATIINGRGALAMARDASGAITVTNLGAWNQVKDAIVAAPINGDVSINNFVDAEVTLGNGISTVAVTGAKRGAITVGNGDDTITVAAKSNDSTNNVMKITAGDGKDHISFSGPLNSVAWILAGNGGNAITVSDQAQASIRTGSGNDDIVDRSTGLVTMTGGAGDDLFEFFAGAHATVTDFQAGHDDLVLHGLSASQVQVTSAGGATLIDLGGGSTIRLAGVVLTAGSPDIVFA